MELGFTSVSAQYWEMLSRINKQLCKMYTLYNESLSMTKLLSTLQVVTQEGKLLTRYGHFYDNISRYTACLQKFCQAGIMKTGKYGKIEDHGIPIIFVSHALDHSQDCYWVLVNNRFT